MLTEDVPPRTRMLWPGFASRPAVTSTSEATDTLVGQLMKQDIYFLAPSDTIRQALHMFVNKRISGVPLLEEDRTLAGFVSDGDVLSINDELGHISSVLAGKHLKKAPVVTDDGTVVGIINRGLDHRALRGRHLEHNGHGLNAPTIP